jgi:hypothetical protein
MAFQGEARMRREISDWKIIPDKFDWDMISGKDDRVARALVALRSRFCRGWDEAFFQAQEAGVPPTWNQDTWDTWLTAIRELVQQTFRDSFEVFLKSERKLPFRPPDFAAQLVLFFIKDALGDGEDSVHFFVQFLPEVSPALVRWEEEIKQRDGAKGQESSTRPDSGKPFYSPREYLKYLESRLADSDAKGQECPTLEQALEYIMSKCGDADAKGQQGPTGFTLKQCPTGFTLKWLYDAAFLYDLFVYHINKKVIALCDEACIHVGLLGCEPPQTEAEPKAMDHPPALCDAAPPQGLKLEDLRTLRRRDPRARKMVRPRFRKLVDDIVRARNFSAGKLPKEELQKAFPTICVENSEQYPMLSQADPEEIRAYTFGSKSHINVGEAAAEIIKARLGRALALSTIRKYGQG